METAVTPHRALSSQEWRSLRIYDRIEIAILNALRSVDDRCLERSSLLTAVQDLLTPVEHKLFKLCNSKLLEDLINRELLQVDRRDNISLSSTLDSRIERLIQGDDIESIFDPISTQVDELTTINDTPLPPPELRYIDPLTRIDDKQNSAYTTRRLDHLISTLDGIALGRASLMNVLGLSNNKDVFSRLIDATDALEITRETDNIIKLHWHGSRLARMDRDSRLKVLTAIAARMRRERD